MQIVYIVNTYVKIKVKKFSVTKQILGMFIWIMKTLALTLKSY